MISCTEFYGQIFENKKVPVFGRNSKHSLFIMLNRSYTQPKRSNVYKNGFIRWVDYLSLSCYIYGNISRKHYSSTERLRRDNDRSSSNSNGPFGTRPRSHWFAPLLLNHNVSTLQTPSLHLIPSRSYSVVTRSFLHRSSSLPKVLLTYSPSSLEPRPFTRSITAIAMRGGAGVIGALSAYVLFQVGQRIDPMQRRRIRKTLHGPQTELKVFRAGALFLQRPEKINFIGEIFNSDPSGPIVVTGPQGSGKTMLIKKCLTSRPGSIYLDLRAQPAQTGEALTRAFVTQAGYLLPPNELLGRAIFTQNVTVGAQTTADEIERAFRLITEVLREEKAKQWVTTMPDRSRRMVPPILTIDELNIPDVAALSEDAAFWRFVEWTMFLTDNRLCHVVFATSLDVAETLDAYPGFRVRRQKVHVDFPRPATVHSYLHNVLNPFLVNVLRAVPRNPPPILPSETAAGSGTSLSDSGENTSGNNNNATEPIDVKPLVSADGTSKSTVTPLTKSTSGGLKDSFDKSSTSTSESLPTITIPKSTKDSSPSPSSTSPISVVDVKTPTTVEIGVPIVTKPKSTDGIGWIKRILTGEETDNVTNNNITSTAMAEAKAIEPSITTASSTPVPDTIKTIQPTVTDKGTDKLASVTSTSSNPETVLNIPSSAVESKEVSLKTNIAVPSTMIKDKHDVSITKEIQTLSQSAATATPTSGKSPISPSDITTANSSVVSSSSLTNKSVSVPPSSTTTPPTVITPAIHPEDMDGEGPSALIAIAQAQAQAAAAAAASTNPMVTATTVLVNSPSVVPSVPSVVVPLVPTVMVVPSSSSTKDTYKGTDGKVSSVIPMANIPNASMDGKSLPSEPKEAVQSDNLKVNSSSSVPQTSVVPTTSTSSISPSAVSGTNPSSVSLSLPNPYAERWVFAPWGLTLPVRHTLEEWEIDRIVDVIGGHLKDLDTVVTAITKGKHWSAALERLVADGADQVERTLEYLLMSADGGPGGNATTTSTTPGSGSGTGTGGGRRTRLRILSASRTVRGTGLPIPSWDYQLRPRPERLAAYGRYLRTWAMLNELAARKYVPRRELLDRIFSGCPHELDFLADAGLVMSVNVKGMTKIEPLHTLETSASSPLEKNIPGTYISASSPRMRFAFRALVQDPRLMKHTNRIRASVKLSLLREEEQVLLRRLPEAVSERSYWYFQAQALLSRDTALRTSVAKELVNMQAAAPVTGSDFLRQGLLTPLLNTDKTGTAIDGNNSATGGGNISVNPSVSTESKLSSLSLNPGGTNSPIPSTPDLPLLGISSLISQFETVNDRMKSYEEEVLNIRKRLTTIRDTISTLETDATATLTMETNEEDDERIRNEIISSTILNPMDNDTNSKNKDTVASNNASDSSRIRNAILERINSDRAVVWALDGLPLPEERLPLYNQQKLWNSKGNDALKNTDGTLKPANGNDAFINTSSSTSATNNDNDKSASSSLTSHGTGNTDNDSPYAFPLRNRYRRLRLYSNSDNNNDSEINYNSSPSSNSSSSSIESTAAWINNSNPRNEYGTSYGRNSHRGVRLRDEDSHIMNTVERSGLHGTNRSQQFGIPWEPDVSYSTGSILNQQNQQNTRRDLRRRYSNSDGYEDYDERTSNEDTSSDSIYAYGGSPYGYSNTSTTNDGYERGGNTTRRGNNDTMVKKSNISTTGRGVFTIRKNGNGNSH